MILRVKLVRSHVPVPQYQSAGAAGIDLHAAIDSAMYCSPGNKYDIPTGVAVEIPEGYEGSLRCRSSFGHKVIFHVGTIDSDFRGEIKARFMAYDMFIVRPGERIAQLVVSPVARCTIQLVDELSQTERGASGFGSTGRI